MLEGDTAVPSAKRLAFVGVLTILALVAGVVAACGNDASVVGQEGIGLSFKEVQRRAPFRVKYPTYLPPNIDPQAVGAVLQSTNSSVPGIIAGLAYSFKGERDADHVPYLHLEETTQNFALLEPWQAPGITRIEVAGLPVDIQSGATLVGRAGSILRRGDEGFYFQWRDGNIFFQLQVLSETKEEALPVLESIIRSR